ncbi:signal peptidase I [Enterococcus sp. AZ177]
MSKIRVYMQKHFTNRSKKNQMNREKRVNIKKSRMLLKEILFISFMIIGVFFLIKIKTHMVSGESMLPTLQTNDRLFIAKGKSPNRYSLITFQPREEKEESYVKRVMGMPGDRIWLDHNTLYLNYQMSDTNPTPQNNWYLSGEELPDGTLKVRVTWETAAKLDGLSAIPENQFFVLGDNRSNSTDSRQLGLIKLKQIEGVVQYRYYPFNRLGPID